MRYVIEGWQDGAWRWMDSGDLGCQTDIPLTIRAAANLRSAKWYRAELETRPKPEIVMVYRYPRSEAGVSKPEVVEVTPENVERYVMGGHPKSAHIDPISVLYYARREDAPSPELSAMVQKINELVAAVNRLQEGKA